MAMCTSRIKFTIIALSVNHGNIFHSKCELRNFWLVVILRTPITNARINYKRLRFENTPSIIRHACGTKRFARKTSKLRWLNPRAKFPHEDSKQGLAKTRPAMTIIVQQAYYNGRGPNTQKVK